MPKNPLDLTEAEVRAAAANRRTRKIDPFKITEAEALAATGARCRGIESINEPGVAESNPVPPENPGPYSHGYYGVLESDNQDKPYIERQLSDEMLRQESLEAAERRR